MKAFVVRTWRGEQLAIERGYLGDGSGGGADGDAGVVVGKNLLMIMLFVVGLGRVAKQHQSPRPWPPHLHGRTRLAIWCEGTLRVS